MKLYRKIVFKLTRQYRHAAVPRWLVLVADCLLLLCSFVVAEIFSRQYAYHIDWAMQAAKFAMVLASTVFCFYMVGSFRIMIRHMGIRDVYNAMISCVIPAAFWILVNWVNNNHGWINSRLLLSYTEVVMTYANLFALMVVFRESCHGFYNRYIRRRRPQQRVLIYGAGAAGIIAKNALMQDQHYEYIIRAFIDDDTSKQSQQVDGVSVLNAKDALERKFIRSNDIKELIIAIPAIRIDHKQEIVDCALNLGLQVKSVPHIHNWINGTFKSNQIEDIKIEDLLERDPIQLDNANIVREVVNKVVLVTGAAGSIGSEICRQLIQYKPQCVVMLDQAESPMYDLQFELKNSPQYASMVDRMQFVIANVKDYRRMEEVFAQYRPQLVYHAAAYKHVPFMEENPYEAIYVNVFGTKNVADFAIKYGTQKFVMISTDKAVNPTNVMGATKRMAEIYIQSRSTEHTHFVTTRFGNVLGSNGSVIPLFKKQLAAGGPLTVTHKEIIRYFMTIPEACNLVLEAGAMGEGGDIFVFDMGKPVRIYDLAHRMIQLSGRTEIQIKEVGLRPGEKLYEELLATKENNMPTYHPKIMRAEVRRYSLQAIDKEYAELEAILPTLDDMKLVAKMKAIVPEFRSNNSVYCELDKPSQ